MNNQRALHGEDLRRIIVNEGTEAIYCESVEEAVKEALDAAEDTDVICAFGSLYYINEVREYFETVENLL